MGDGSFTLVLVSDFGSKTEKNRFESRSSDLKNLRKVTVPLLLVGAMPPHAGITPVPPPLVGATCPHAGGGDGSALSTHSVSFRSSPVVSSIAPPPGISRQDEYELLSLAVDKMSTSCCRWRDFMSSLVERVDLKALLALSP